MSEHEEWKTIPSFPNYEASSTGRIRRATPGQGARKYHVLSQGLTRRNNCKYVNLHGTSKTVHRLILETFVGPCPPGKECNHKNGNRHDNRLCNLEWITRSENQKHAFRTGLHVPVRGTKHGAAKLNEAAVASIRQMLTLRTSITKIAALHGVHPSQIISIKKGRNWGWLQ